MEAGGTRRLDAPRKHWWHSRPLVWAIAGGGAALGAVTTVIAADYQGADPFRVPIHAVSGSLFIISGVIAHERRTSSPIGLLMVAVGVGFFSEDLRLSGTAWIYTVGLLTTAASGGFLAHLVLAFPTGRLASRGQRALVTAAYSTVIGKGMLNALFEDWHRYRPDNPPNLLLITDSHYVALAVQYGSQALAVFISAGLTLVLVNRWIRARALMRRLLAPVVAVMLSGTVVSTLGSVIDHHGTLHAQSLRIYDLLFAALPLGFLLGMTRLYLGRSAVGKLLLQLRRPLTYQELRALLADSLGDDSLQVAYQTPAGLVDELGSALRAAPQNPPRAVTAIGRDGQQGAVLVHDPLLLEDSHVLDSVAAAAGIALENQALAAQVTVQLAEIRASRARIVEAGDAERRRLERDLHDGAQQRLIVAMLGVRLARQRLPSQESGIDEVLADVMDGLEVALRELRELARGLHPAILTEAGLAAAIEALAERLPLDVEVVVSPPPELAPGIEASVYFIVAEALTNALKHADATHLSVMVKSKDAEIWVRVRDDGRGGADLAHGTGLLGMHDRVAALGGKLLLHSPDGVGTTVEAVLPLEPR